MSGCHQKVTQQTTMQIITDNHKCGSTKIGTPKVLYSKQGNLLCEQNDFLAKGA